jgi:hypothetical protein
MQGKARSRQSSKEGNMSTLAKKTTVGALTALLFGFGVAASTPAAAQWRGGWGAPFAAGVLGGAAVGALAARPYYYPYPAPAYAPGCYWQRQPTYDPYGNFAGYRRVQVCY